MTHIAADNNVLTFINVFTVEPADQDRLIELLTAATDISVRYADGFISCSLHRGLDGTKVTMYAQWKSMEHYMAMRNDPKPLPYFQEALKIATFDSCSYEVVKTFESLSM